MIPSQKPLPSRSGFFLSFAFFPCLPTFASMENMNLFSAIAEMRKLTAQGIPFSFEHHTWDSERRQSNGLRRVHKALLRPAAKGDNLANADHKLFYEDLTISDPAKARRNCWQILIVRFNGITLTPQSPFYENI